MSSDLPFGFEASGREPERREPGGGPPGASGGPGSGSGPEDLLGKIPLFAELQKLFTYSGGPVNWDLARQGAIGAVAGGHRPVSDEERQAVRAALDLADLWLGEVTELPSGITTATAWSRVEWIEKTLPVWSNLCDPVAAQIAATMTAVIPPEAAQAAGQMGGMLKALGGMMFGAQVGQAMASLSGEVLTGTDIGLPLAPPGTAVLLPQNVTEFSTGLGLPDDEIRLFLALREAAHQRLFGHVPWLRQRLLDTVESYARGITVDVDAMRSKMEEAMGSVDPTNPETLQAALQSGMFTPQESPEQQRALARLETLLALTEGWVDAVVYQACAQRLPGAVKLTETIRRRRASGGPAEQTFATLVGLELRPRRLRDAATLWAALHKKHGIEGRDRLWNHPDLLPSTEDLDDPEAFASRGHGDGSATEWSVAALDEAGPAPTDPERDDPSDGKSG
ncbi:MAG: zinc-dependent metalloprotease [Geodermatophilaceae bacterium]|nr:zinc-dependent metalloprotease [Geodermatophilaceae bacterium]